MHGLKQRSLARMNIARRRQSEPSGQLRAKIANDVPE